MNSTTAPRSPLGFELPRNAPAAARTTLHLLQRLVHGSLTLQLRKGDHLRSANGQSIASVADLLRALRAAAGTPVTVEVVRAQAPLTLHWAASLYAPLLPPAPPPPPSPPRSAR